MKDERETVYVCATCGRYLGPEMVAESHVRHREGHFYTALGAVKQQTYTVNEETEDGEGNQKRDHWSRAIAD